MRRLLFALLAFNFFIGQSNTKNNFLKNVAVSYNIWPACKMGSKSRKAALVIKRLLWRLSFITFWRQWKLQRWIANHKLLVFWLIHYWIRSFCQTWIFSKCSYSMLPSESNFHPYYPNFEFFHKILRFAFFLSVDNYFTFKNSKKKKFLLSQDENTKCQFKRWEH